MNIVEALSDRKLFGAAFPELGSWRPWLAALRVLFGLPMPDVDRELVARCTGLSALPSNRSYSEGWFIVGRRGGKSRIAAAVAVFLATMRTYSMLAAGERGVVMVIASDRKQARVIFGYVEAILDGSTMLSQLVRERKKEQIDLTNGISIEVTTASFRTVRGYTVVAAIADEIAFWSAEESANPDVEILAALRPAMATVPGAMLLAIGSPYARRGAMWETYRKHFATPGAVLVWQASSQTMNPQLPAHVVEDAFERDPERASAEYGAEFRRDIASFVAPEAIDACVEPGRTRRAYVDGESYVAFCDPSGGSSDSMTLAIAHRESEKAVLDLVLERKPPFSPDDVVSEFAETLSAYGVTNVLGDRYGGEWVTQRFTTVGIIYEPSAKAKSDIYREFLPLLNSGAVELLDDKKLLAQLQGLERRVGRSGRDSIDHAPGGHDDVINAVAGALVMLADDPFDVGLTFSGSKREEYS